MKPTAPRASGWSSGRTPLPWNVVATGMQSFSANRRTAPAAPARAAPWPASRIGFGGRGQDLGGAGQLGLRRFVRPGPVDDQGPSILGRRRFLDVLGDSQVNRT